MTKLPGLGGELFLLNVSCPSQALCVATGTQNVIASSTNPTGGADAWHVVYAGEGAYESPSGPVISNRQVQGVSCPTVHLCVAVTTLGQIYSTTDPTGPAKAWHVAEVSSSGRNTHLYGVSCPTASFCVAVSGRRVNTGEVFVTTNPTGGIDDWKMTELGEQFDFRAVSCSSPSLWVAAGANGELVASTNPAGGRSAWSSIGTPDGSRSMQTVFCNPGLCLSGNRAGNILTSTDPLSGSSWQVRSSSSSVAITGSACPTASACIAVDANGHVHASTNPTGPSSAWTDTVVAPYTSEAEEFDPEHPNGLFGASCPSESFCAVVGSGGQIFTSTAPFAPGPSAGPAAPTRHVLKRPKIRVAKLILPSTRQLRAHRGRVTVRFYPNGPVERVECKIDHRHWRVCRSPWRFRVGRGVYAIRLRAVGVTGLRGPIALKRFWTGRRCRRNQCLTGGGELSSSGRRPSPRRPRPRRSSSGRPGR